MLDALSETKDANGPVFRDAILVTSKNDDFHESRAFELGQPSVLLVTDHISLASRLIALSADFCRLFVEMSNERAVANQTPN